MELSLFLFMRFAVNDVPIALQILHLLHLDPQMTEQGQCHYLISHRCR
jgi:hypothetical protein